MAKKIKIFFPNGKDFIETDSENLDFYLSQGYKKEEDKIRQEFTKTYFKEMKIWAKEKTLLVI